MHVRLIDANSLGHPNSTSTRTPDTWGAVEQLRRFLQKSPQVLNVLLWDGKADWRHERMPAHNEPANRKRGQTSELAHFCQWLPVVQLTHPGADAGDLAWGLSRQLERQGNRVTLYTCQPHWLQMVSSRTGWANAHKSQLVELDGFTLNSGGFLRPRAVADVLAISGNPDHRLSGLPGFNLKKAIALVASFGSLRSALEAAENFSVFSSEPAYHLALMVDEHRTRVALNHELMDLSRGPALNGEDVLAVEGEYCELNLFEQLMDSGFIQDQIRFEAWSRGLGRNLDKPNLQALRRGVAAMADSWDAV